MEFKLDEIVENSKLVIQGQYIESLYGEINKTEKYLEDFYKRAKKEIDESRTELRKCESKIMIPDDVRKQLETLHSALDPSAPERDTILRNMQTEIVRIQNLPFLNKDKEFESRLKKDRCLVEVVYSLDENSEYESDFETDSDSDSESQRNTENAEKKGEIYSSFDQVGGRMKAPFNPTYRTDVEFSGARPKLSSNSTVHQTHYAKQLKPDFDHNSSEAEQRETGICEGTDSKVSEERGRLTKMTSQRQMKNRAAVLRDLTEHSKYTLNEKEETIYSFSELKHNLADVDIQESHYHPSQEFKVMDEGNLELPTCTDVNLFDTYIVTASGEHIVKVDRETNKILGKLKLSCAGHMCSIRQSRCIGVVQTNSFITVVATEPDLKVLYKIKTTKAYTNICHVDTHSKTPRNVPDPSFTFGLVYTDISSTKGRRFDEKIDIVKATATTVYQKIPQYDAQVDAFDVTPFDVSGISGIGAVWSQGTLKFILGCAENIICLEKSKSRIEKKWNIAIKKGATDVVCVTSKAYICVQDEGRIMLVGTDGKVESENILEGLLECLPHRLSVSGDTLLVKSFEESRWKSLVFAKQK